ncbi:hypothetical protein ACOME3_001556 [Neoechinorhynchus agilis]
MKPYLILLLTTSLIFTLKTCIHNSDALLNIHIIPHSHMDVGWLKTVEEYYYGLNDQIQHAGVQFIFDSVVKELTLDHDKTFVFCEMAYFWRWWMRQSNSTKHTVKSLLTNGQLQIVGGGWVSNDEACAHYGSVIEQMALGLRFLNLNFNYVPNVTWQIDPFGHSIEHARIFYDMGFKGMFINRIDHYAAQNMANTRSHEFLWMPDRERKINTIHIPRHYNPPKNLCFDEFCNEDPVIDDKSSFSNIDDKLDSLTVEAMSISEETSSRHVMIPMGSDFHYQNAWHSFKSLDKLIKAFNNKQVNSSIKAFYSTPACFMESVYRSLKDLNISVVRRWNDFVPHSHSQGLYWTGYYTSRPGLKKLIRTAYDYLRAYKMIKSRFTLNDNKDWDYFSLEESHAVVQHHDAIP